MDIDVNENTTIFTYLYTLHFADDQVVVVQDKVDLEFMTRRLFKEYEKCENMRKLKTNTFALEMTETTYTQKTKQ